MNIIVKAFKYLLLSCSLSLSFYAQSAKASDPIIIENDMFRITLNNPDEWYNLANKANINTATIRNGGTLTDYSQVESGKDAVNRVVMSCIDYWSDLIIPTTSHKVNLSLSLGGNDANGLAVNSVPLYSVSTKTESFPGTSDSRDYTLTTGKEYNKCTGAEIKLRMHDTGWFTKTDALDGSISFALSVDEISFDQAGPPLTKIPYYDYGFEDGYLQYDFETMLLHEIGHSVGITSSKNTGKDQWSIINIENPKNCPITAWDALLNVDNYLIYEYLLYKSWNPEATENPYADITQPYITEDLLKMIEEFEAENGDAEYKMYIGPAGLEIVQVDTGHSGNGDPDGLMIGNIEKGEIRRALSDKELQLLEIMGYNLNINTNNVIPEPSSTVLFLLGTAALICRRTRRIN